MPTGSEVICPSDAPNDFDVVGLGTQQQARRLIELGWEIFGSMQDDVVSPFNGKFVSMRKGDVNLICCFDEGFCNRFKRATAVCLLLNEDMSDKAKRIEVFRSILYPKESPIDR